MSLLVKALRQLDARKAALPTPVDTADNAIDLVEREITALVDREQISEPEVATVQGFESKIEPELNVSRAAESVAKAVELPAVQDTTKEFDEHWFGFDSTPYEASELALIEAKSESRPPDVDLPSTPVAEPLQSDTKLPTDTADPIAAVFSAAIEPTYPTLSETSTALAVEEFPAITTPSNESLLTEIDLTESTVVPATTERVERQIETALDRLDELRALISAGDDQQAATQDEPVLLPISQRPAGEFHIREEFRELRDHLLARYALPRGAAVLFVDAGRKTSDCSWLFPLAASLLQHFAELSPTATFGKHAARILLIEAAGPESGLASSLGLSVVAGLSDVLQSGAPWKSAVQSTWHPQIDLLGRGTEPLAARHESLPDLFKDLAESYDVLLIAAGPTVLHAGGHSGENRSSPSAAFLLAECANAAVLCLELDGTPQPVAAQVKRNFAASGINLLGCVVQCDAAAA
jgi:Mrp family chromosome partitioning ATPase